MFTPARNPIIVTEKFIRYNTPSICDFLNEYFGGNYEVVDPRIALDHPDYGQPTDWTATNAWFLTAQQGERRWLIDLITTDTHLLGNDSPGFCNWLHDFMPKNSNDWLAAPMLYRRFVLTGKFNCLFEENTDSFLQRVLAPTRGLLLWTSQLEFLIQFALNETSSTSEVDRLVTGYRRQNSDVLAELEHLKIDGRSLRTIFYHHTNGLHCFMGGPNHYISGFLSEHFDHFEFDSV